MSETHVINNNPKFSSLKSTINKMLLKSLNYLGFKRMTDIQAAVIPKAFTGADIVAAAKTGSGKTLAFLIPVIEFTTRSLDAGTKGFKRMTDIQAAVIPKAFTGADIVAAAKTGSGKTLAFLIPVIEFTTRSLDAGTKGFKRMTDIQAAVIPKAFTGADIVAAAKTGSGKTLAFLIPVIEFTTRSLDAGTKGTCSIIVSPTRELAMQSYNVLKQLIVLQTNITCSLLIGGESRKNQAIHLAKGVQIIVATPGRLLDHMKSKEFVFKNLKCLVLDEADKILQYGFEEDLKQIINLLPGHRQTLLFSATQSDKTAALTKLAMKDDVEFISTSDDSDVATVEGLKHGYVICKTEDRLWWLFKILKKTRKQKVMVFFSSCKSVEFHHEFFKIHCNAPVLCIHGKMNQMERTKTMQEFYRAKKGTLFCTDLAARGLDIPAVDWIVQFDPPGDTTEYIHRVGRTARGIGGVGNAVLLLRPEEKDFLKYLQEVKVYVELYKMWDDYENLQLMLEKLIDNNEHFKELAIEAYKGYIRAFEVRKLKDVFNLLTLDLYTLAKSFGLKEKPEIDIRMGFKKKHRARKRTAALLDNSLNSSKLIKL